MFFAHNISLDVVSSQELEAMFVHSEYAAPFRGGGRFTNKTGPARSLIDGPKGHAAFFASDLNLIKSTQDLFNPGEFVPLSDPQAEDLAVAVRDKDPTATQPLRSGRIFAKKLSQVLRIDHPGEQPVRQDVAH